MLNKKILLILALIAFLPACSRLSIEQRNRGAEEIAAFSNMEKIVIKAGLFDLTTWQRVARRGEVVNIYIEGDGLAWVSKNKVSANPTPIEPLALELATRDRAPNVIYIARPCQYTGWNKDGYCSSLYWTTGRTAPEVMASFQSALDQIKKQYSVPAFNLLGYSGGAAVAAIITAGRDDIKSLRTVAGNIDYEAFTSHHKVTPMGASIDPSSVAYEINQVPQLHFIGSNDEIVPELIFNRWQAVSNNDRCVKKLIVEGVTHNEGWAEEWDRLQKLEPACY